MASNAIEYLTNTQGEPSAVVIPISLWKEIFPEGAESSGDITEGIEDYCLSKAMDEAKETPLLNREAALAFLEEASD